MDIEVYPPATLSWGNRNFACAIGRGGVRADKREGDGATPLGRWPLRHVLYRPDRVSPPQTPFPSHRLTPSDGWCDDPADSAYNQQVSVPYPASHETLWREDHVYDVIVVLGHNDAPVIPGYGSAIFMHVARPRFEPTEGCVALRIEDLMAILEDCDLGTAVNVHPPA